MAISSKSSYGFTNNNYYTSQNTICKKIVLHNFDFLCKEMFADYYYKKNDSLMQSIEFIGIGIKVDKNDTNELPTVIPFKNFFVTNDEDVQYYAKGLYTYPERNLRYTENKEFNAEWYETFKESESDSDNRYIDGIGELHELDIQTKIHDIEKKYPNDLKSIKISTAVHENIELHKDISNCDTDSADCLYFILNNDYEIICGGFNQNINDKTKAIVIPPEAIYNMGVKCNNPQCESCPNCVGGKCTVYKIVLKNCVEYLFNGLNWIKQIGFSINWKEYLSNQSVLTKFYFVKKVENTDTSYSIQCEIEAENKKNPYGSLWFNNKGYKIVRKYFAKPNIMHTTLNSVPYLPIMFTEHTEYNICNKFEIIYNYYIPIEIFISITKNSEIKTYISFNKSFKNDELLLGSIEIPQNDFIPSFDSTLNINEECQKGITDIRHNKLINDNHQRIKFDEICNQTNRLLMQNVIKINFNDETSAD